MAKINKLPVEISNLIAAGEVVERPASVVKELMENAVDAGADTITVEIQNGGIKFIRVTDNGCGIAREDVKTAFQSHATSKISSADDLNSIMTLGFRGEALPSIAAVSKVNLITRTETEEFGTSLNIEGGEITDIFDAGCAVGTTFIVREIFYNTPARMKFLKKDVSEGNFVAAVVEKIALANPQISIKFIRDGKNVFMTQGNGELRGVCYSAFGKDFCDGLISVDSVINGIRVHGLVTPPYNSRGSRGMQYFFVNGRSIRNSTVTAAFEAAYKNTVMVGKFPGGVLFIEISPERVDVNVHPSKIEVRFSDEHALFDAVFHSVKSQLDNIDSFKQAQITPSKPANVQVLQKKYTFNEPQSAEQTVISQTATPSFDDKFTVFDSARNSNSYHTDENDNGIEIEFPVVKNAEPTETIIEEKSAPLVYNEDFKILGEAFKTYIFVELSGSVFVIDKHAAHERINFNNLKETDHHTGSQILIEPVSVTLGKDEYTAVLENLDLVCKAGFDTEDFGNGSVIVRSCPSSLDSQEISPLIGELAGYLIKSKKDIVNEKMDWIYH
ncbi:MAG: DNA mismatch repair endonuclease MutL, partial [Oscillospiraceae bacterium]|nr:DNA mismatch repair endonuclease MutL [Oscillospiraceae bacterium]